MTVTYHALKRSIYCWKFAYANSRYERINVNSFHISFRNPQDGSSQAYPVPSTITLSIDMHQYTPKRVHLTTIHYYLHTCNSTTVDTLSLNKVSDWMRHQIWSAIIVKLEQSKWGEEEWSQWQEAPNCFLNEPQAAE